MIICMLGRRADSAEVSRTGDIVVGDRLTNDIDRLGFLETYMFEYEYPKPMEKYLFDQWRDAWPTKDLTIEQVFRRHAPPPPVRSESWKLYDFFGLVTFNDLAQLTLDPSLLLYVQKHADTIFNVDVEDSLAYKEVDFLRIQVYYLGVIINQMLEHIQFVARDGVPIQKKISYFNYDTCTEPVTSIWTETESTYNNINACLGERDPCAHNYHLFLKPHLASCGPCKTFCNTTPPLTSRGDGHNEMPWRHIGAKSNLPTDVKEWRDHFLDSITTLIHVHDNIDETIIDSTDGSTKIVAEYIINELFTRWRSEIITYLDTLSRFPDAAAKMRKWYEVVLTTVIRAVDNELGSLVNKEFDTDVVFTTDMGRGWRNAISEWINTKESVNLFLSQELVNEAYTLSMASLREQLGNHSAPAFIVTAEDAARYKYIASGSTDCPDCAHSCEFENCRCRRRCLNQADDDIHICPSREDLGDTDCASSCISKMFRCFARRCDSSCDHYFAEESWLTTPSSSDDVSSSVQPQSLWPTMPNIVKGGSSDVWCKKCRGSCQTNYCRCHLDTCFGPKYQLRDMNTQSLMECAAHYKMRPENQRCTRACDAQYDTCCVDDCRTECLVSDPAYFYPVPQPPPPADCDVCMKQCKYQHCADDCSTNNDVHALCHRHCNMYYLVTCLEDCSVICVNNELNMDNVTLVQKHEDAESIQNCSTCLNTCKATECANCFREDSLEDCTCQNDLLQCITDDCMAVCEGTHISDGYNTLEMSASLAAFATSITAVFSGTPINQTGACIACEMKCAFYECLCKTQQCLRDFSGNPIPDITACRREAEFPDDPTHACNIACAASKQSCRSQTCSLVCDHDQMIRNNVFQLYELLIKRQEGKN